jgi:hypothetical protein
MVGRSPTMGRPKRTASAACACSTRMTRPRNRQHARRRRPGNDQVRSQTRTPESGRSGMADLRSPGRLTSAPGGHGCWVRSSSHEEDGSAVNRPNGAPSRIDGEWSRAAAAAFRRQGQVAEGGCCSSARYQRLGEGDIEGPPAGMTNDDGCSCESWLTTDSGPGRENELSAKEKVAPRAIAAPVPRGFEDLQLRGGAWAAGPTRSG